MTGASFLNRDILYLSTTAVRDQGIGEAFGA
jgi:hypothetical protein